MRLVVHVIVTARRAAPGAFTMNESYHPQ